VTGAATVEPGAAVTAHFSWAQQLRTGDPGKTPLDAIIHTIGDIQQQLDTLGTDVAGGSPVAILGSPQFRVLMNTLKQQSVSLPAGLRNLVSDVAEGTEGTIVSGATSEIEALYVDLVQQPCRTVIAGRYPFANSSTDVQLGDFSAIFGFDGVFDKFFNEHLAKQVDSSGPTWTWRPGSIRPTHDLLTQFQAAQQLRDMFFPAGSKTPAVKFFVTFSDMDTVATRFILQIDGVNFDDKHGARQSGTWPGPQPGVAATSFESRYYDPTQSRGGPWAWFRLIDETRIGAPDPQRVLLNVRNPHHSIRITVEPGSAGASPFTTGAWRQFTCES
jgi:type VI secretion system protein ImpL